MKRDCSNETRLYPTQGCAKQTAEGQHSMLKKLLETMTQVEQTCETSDTGLRHADSDNNHDLEGPWL